MRLNGILQDRGLITGCDANQEWLLKCWWFNYKKFNDYPITFVDFGLTKSARLWCEERGQVIDTIVFPPFLKGKKEIDPIKAKFWERIYAGDLWKARPSWFSKPLALLKTSYKESIWVDLDTKIQEDLRPLFDFAKEDFAIMPAWPRYQKFSRIVGLHLKDEKLYNTGVIIYKKGSKVLKKWADHAVMRNHEFLGDENVLNRLLHEEKFQITELPIEYNWPYFEGENPKAAIIHYLGGQGKFSLFLQ